MKRIILITLLLSGCCTAEKARIKQLEEELLVSKIKAAEPVIIYQEGVK